MKLLAYTIIGGATLFAALWLQMMIGQRRLAAADARRLAANKAGDRLWRIVDSEYRHHCSCDL